VWTTYIETDIQLRNSPQLHDTYLVAGSKPRTTHLDDVGAGIEFSKAVLALSIGRYPTDDAGGLVPGLYASTDDYPAQGVDDRASDGAAGWRLGWRRQRQKKHEGNRQNQTRSAGRHRRLPFLA
jgi:hypothetical protein